MESLSQKKEPEIRGFVKIKRKRFWAERYAEIQNNIFFYYKNREDTTARGIIQLKGASVQEKKSSENEYIIAIIRINSMEKNNETLLIKNEYEINHKKWLKVLLDSINQMNAPKVQETVEKQTTQSSILEPAQPIEKALQIEKRHSLVGQEPKRNSALICEAELLKNNLGNNLITLRANVNHFVEIDENFFLSDVQSDIRVLTKRMNSKTTNRKITDENLGLNRIIKITEKLRGFVLDAKEKLGDLFFSIFCIVGIVLFVIAFYLVLELTNWHTFLVTLALTFNLIALPIIYEKTVQKMNLQIKNVDVTKDFQNNSNFKLKAITALPFSGNEILYVLKNINSRKLWHPNILSLTTEDKQLKCVYKLPNKTTYTERFTQTVYQKEKSVYVVEHNSALNPIRVFELKCNKLVNHKITLCFYAFSNAEYMSSINPAVNPIILNGLKMFIYELRTDNKSFLWEYLGNKLVDIEDEDLSSSSDEPAEQVQQPDPANRQQTNEPASRQQTIEQPKSLKSEAEQAGSAEVSIKKDQEIPQKKQQESIVEESKKDEEPDHSALSPYNKTVLEKLKKAQEKLEKIVSLQSEANWVQVEKKEEVTYHMKNDSTTGLTWTRGEGKIAKTADEIRAFIVDISTKAQYDSMFQEGKMIDEFLPGYSITHQKFKGMAFVGGRDFILGGSTEVKSDGTIILVAASVEHPEYPPAKGFVRGEVLLGGWILTPIKGDKPQTNCIYITIMDPKGSIPKKVVEMASSKQAYVVLGVRKAIEKAKN